LLKPDSGIMLQQQPSARRLRGALAVVVVVMAWIPTASPSPFDFGRRRHRRGVPSFAIVGRGGGGGSVDINDAASLLKDRVPFTTKPRGGARTASTDNKASSSVEVRSSAGSAPAGTKKNETEDFSNAPVSQVGQVTDREEPLIHNIELLGDILSDIVKSEDPQVHSLFEEFRQYGFDRAAESTSSATTTLEKQQQATVTSEAAASQSMARALDKMVARASQLTAKEALGLMRSFSIMLNLVNSAEVQHRQRRIRQRESAQDAVGGPLPLVEDSVRGTMDALLAANMATPDQLYQQLVQQRVEIVLTAHPTEVQRKSLLRKYSQVSELLGYLDRPDLSAFERSSAHSDLQRIISSIWGADEIRRTKPTPQQEAGGGNAVLESVLWDAVPSYLRKLDAQCRMTLNRRLPIDVVPIKFASWIGGDRDGACNLYKYLPGRAR
jgi:Phosphoenolpyruvate carboxylase